MQVIKQKKGIFLLCITAIICLFAFFIPNQNQSFVYAYTAETHNNVFFFKFVDDTANFNDTYQVSAGVNVSAGELVENAFQNHQYSVNKYYEVISNNNMNMQSHFYYENYTNKNAYTLNSNRVNFMNGSANDGGYTEGVLTEALVMRSLINLILPVIKEQLSNATYELDSDEDGYVDSVSIIIVDNDNYVINWSDLLWPHSAGLASYGGFFDLTVPNKTCTLDRYLLMTLATFDDSYIADESLYINNDFTSTAIHEMAHVLGYPDLYIYTSEDNTTQNSRPVGIWDMMEANMFQTMTAYSRYSQGWLEDSNIVDITDAGNYSLKPTTYEINEYYENGKVGTWTIPSDRTMAYRISDTRYPNQYIYLEYRKVGNHYDVGASYATGGLLVYRVDKNLNDSSYVIPGNRNAASYGVYVFRNNLTGSYGTSDMSLNQFAATLNTYNNKMGTDSVNQSYTSNAPLSLNGTYSTNLITYQIYTGNNASAIDPSDVNYVDSGLNIEVTEINNSTDELTFTVYGGQLNSLITPPQLLSNDDFEDDNLFYKLKSLNSGENIYTNTFASNTFLNLSNSNISTLDGLEKLDLTELLYLDLSGNNLSNIFDITTFTNIKTDVVCINLNNNNFALDLIDNDILNNSKFIFGFQNMSVVLNTYFNSSLTISAYFKSSDELNFTFNYGTPTSSNTTNHTFTYSYYTTPLVLTFTPKSSGNFVGTTTYTKTISHIVQVSFNIINLELNQLLVPFNTKLMPLLNNAMVVEGATKSQISILSSTILSVSLGTNMSGNIIVSFNGNEYTIATNYNVVDTTAPVLTLTSLPNVSISLNDTMPAITFNSLDNGEVITYNYLQNPEITDKNFYSYKFYYSNISTELGNEIAVFSSGHLGFVTVKIYAVDNSGNKSSYVTVVVEIKDKTPPILILNGNSTIYLSKGDVYTDLGVEVSDNVDQNPTCNFKNNAHGVNTNLPGTYLVVYEAEDSSGNVSEITRTIIILSSDKKLFTNNELTVDYQGIVVFDITMFDVTLPNSNYTIEWYVNDVKVKSGSDVTYSQRFNNQENNVMVKVVSQGGGTVASTNSYVVNVNPQIVTDGSDAESIIDTSFEGVTISKTTLFIIIGAILFLIFIVIIRSIIREKNR